MLISTTTILVSSSSLVDQMIRTHSRMIEIVSNYKKSKQNGKFESFSFRANHLTDYDSGNIPNFVLSVSSKIAEKRITIEFRPFHLYKSF